MEKNNNLKNEIISTKANTLKALEKIITKAFIEEMLIIVVEDYVKNKREAALNIGKKFNGANIVGIEEYFNDKTATIDLFNLYPNPTNGNSYIAFKNKLEGQTTIEIYSITGQLVYSNVKNSIFDRTVIELPTANLSNAMYIVNVKNENTTVSKKLIINK